MTGRTRFTAWALWLFAASLLLKAAMPLLAQASAQLQRKALVEICTVYGVSLAPPGGDQKSPSPEPVGGHAGEPCALSGLTALATATNLPALAQPPAAPSDRVALPLRAAPAAIDACAAWVARLQHGPPAFA